MTRDEVIRMAREAGFEVDTDNVWITDGYWLTELTRFANAIEAEARAAEREACAKVCDAEAAAYLSDMKVIARNCAAAIRLRGSDLIEEAWEQAIK